MDAGSALDPGNREGLRHLKPASRLYKQESAERTVGGFLCERKQTVISYSCSRGLSYLK
ncbi:Uncharacterized protein DAT39_001295, partial [Clarias magur]